jgi:putative ABC transport system permease protein
LFAKLTGPDYLRIKTALYHASSDQPFSGIAMGAVGAIILTRTLASFSRLLSRVGSGDPLTFATISFVLMVVAAVAGYIPARRAARVDPIVALRYE